MSETQEWNDGIFVREENGVEVSFVNKSPKNDVQSIAAFKEVFAGNILELLEYAFDKEERRQEGKNIDENSKISPSVKAKLKLLLDEIKLDRLSFEEFSSKLQGYFNEKITDIRDGNVIEVLNEDQKKLLTEGNESIILTEEQQKIRIRCAELVDIFIEDSENVEMAVA